MLKLKSLILAAVLVCFTIMAVNSNCVLADDAVEQKILKKVKKLIIKVDREVLPRLGSVPKTGQTTSYATGDDGDLQKGIAPPNPRFTDNGDGTVTDNLTGLMWTKDANIYLARTWGEALSDCASCTEGTYDDWRLPNRFELESLLDLGQYDPVLPSGHPFAGVQSAYYWSSTTYEVNTNLAWTVDMVNGHVYLYSKIYHYYVWPVRGPN